MTSLGASAVVPEAIAAGAAIQPHFVERPELQWLQVAREFDDGAEDALAAAKFAFVPVSMTSSQC